MLARADNLAWDGGSTALRSYLIYRYVALTYRPALIGRVVLLVRPDRLDRLPEEWRRPTTDARLRALDVAFAQPSLGLLPVSWGRSSASLERQLRPVRRLGDAPLVDNATTFELGSPGLAGGDAGMLGFEFACDRPDVTLEASWHGAEATGSVRFDGREGRLLVPLDASPRWLLAPGVSRLRLAIVAGNCARATVRNVRLWQRRLVGPDGDGPRHEGTPR